MSLDKGFMKMSASWLSVATNWISQSPLVTWSRIKWWRISMCLVLECWTWFFVRFIALVLSHNKETLLTFNPKSSSYCLIHKICAQQLPATIYFASTVDKATQACFLLCHEIRLDPSRWHVPLVLFLSNLHPAKSELEYPTKWIGKCEGYHKPMDGVPLRYLRILLVALRWNSFGQDWNLAQRQTTNIISGLLAVRYSKEPINPLYLVWCSVIPASTILK